MADSRLRVLHLVPKPPPFGGMATFAAGLLDSPLAEQFQLRAISVYAIDKGRFGGWVRTLASLVNMGIVSARLNWALLTWSPDIVHIQTNSGTGLFEKAFFALQARVYRRKAVMHVHGGGLRDRYCRSLPAERWLIRKAIGASNHVIVASPSMVETFRELIGMTDDRFTRIGNAVTVPAECRADRPIPNEADGIRGPVRVLFLNRVTEEKGVFDLVRAFHRVLAQCPMVHLRIVGPTTAAMQRRLEEEELGRVTLVGAIPEAQKVDEYLAADIFALPSHCEDMPYGVLESMAAGLPCVASAVGGIPSMLTDGHTGVLVPPRNVDALAAAIVTLARDPARRRAIGAAARDRVVDRHSWQRLAADVGLVYAGSR